jgi:hypothetical protein
MSHVSNFLSMDWAKLSEDHPDFTAKRQNDLKNMMDRCANDTGFDHTSGDHGSDEFKWFEMCLSNNIGASISLNQSSTIRQNVLGWGY